MLFVFSNTLSGAGSWTFVIDRWRVCSSCFPIRSHLQEERMLFVLSNVLPCAGSWTSVIFRRRVCSSCFAIRFSCPGSWIFVIYRRRVCSSCFLIWSRAPVTGLLWLAGGAYALRVF